MIMNQLILTELGAVGRYDVLKTSGIVNAIKPYCIFHSLLLSWGCEIIKMKPSDHRKVGLEAVTKLVGICIVRVPIDTHTKGNL